MTIRLRADAERNRAALLAAAQEIFGEQGLDASLDEIARRAGVGNATLYRRFPRRRDLITEVFAERVAEYVKLAERALAEHEPWPAFVDCLTRICEMQAANRGLSDLLLTNGYDDDERLADLRATAQQLVGELIRRAQDAGALRGDFTVHDVRLLMMTTAGVMARSTQPDAWRRQLTLFVEGLGAAG